jgi:hypothetical protein
VEDEARGNATTAFVDAVSIWRVTDGATADVIFAAAHCLAEGLDSPSLRMLAGESPRESRFVVGPMVEDTIRELGLAEVLDDDAQRTALRAMVRRFLSGDVAAHDLARWAHAYIGHEGDAACQPFVELDDHWDEVDFHGASEAALQEWTLREAEAFMAGDPSPGGIDVWRVPDYEARSDERPKPRDRLRRLFGLSPRGQV